MMLLFVLMLLFSVEAAAGCHPECRWACDDPVCQAVCHPVCDTPVCILVNASNTACDAYQPSCSVQCPENMCESDACPACETICQAPSDLCNDGQLLCEATNCQWRCEKPKHCQHPRCELVCERPACEAASGAQTRGGGLLVGIVFLVAFLSA